MSQLKAQYMVKLCVGKNPNDSLSVGSNLYKALSKMFILSDVKHLKDFQENYL